MASNNYDHVVIKRYIVRIRKISIIPLKPDKGRLSLDAVVLTVRTFFDT